MAKTVLITGGTRGIGAACAHKFYTAGYNIALVYASDDAAAQKFVSDKDMSRVVLIKADVSDYAAMQSAADAITKKFGDIDVLVNNAGIACQKMMNDITEADWDRMFDVNVKGCFNCVKAVMDGMIHNKWGRIINISSMWGQVGASCEVHYSAAKAAVIGFTKALAKELAPSGITVNCVAPGVIDTDMNKILDSETIDALAEETPVGRIGSGDDVAEAVMFLAGEGSSFVTGQVLGVNGGMIV